MAGGPRRQSLPAQVGTCGVQDRAGVHAGAGRATPVSGVGELTAFGGPVAGTGGAARERPRVGAASHPEPELMRRQFCIR